MGRRGSLLAAGRYRASTRLKVGIGGNDGVSVAGFSRDMQGAFMGRSTWTNLANADWLVDGPLPAYNTANPTGAALIGVPLIPHDSVSSTGWNALLDSASSGAHDADYVSMGGNLAAVTAQTCYCRLWWEFNANDTNIDATKFKAAYAQAVPKIRQGFAAAAPAKTLKIVFNSMPDRSTKEALYPGGAYVDIVSYDVYGKTYGSTNQTKTFALNQINGYLAALVAWGQSVGKPVALDEWGNWQVKPADGTTTNRGFGDWPEYITAVFDWATNPANNVLYVAYFNEPGGDVGITLDDQPNSRAVFVSRANAVK